MPISPGEKLGPYEIIASIGSGGMGEVYRARDPRLNRDVAIKRLKDNHSARFEQEARAIAALNHPHICQIYDIGPDYLVMEYVEGSPLKGPLPVEEAVRLARQITEAMTEAHGKGILHRDLKPGNILLARSGVKVLDFGLAKSTGESEDGVTLTIEGTVLGTAAYMSPEQAQGKPLDQRSDIFSFGAVLYELLSGQRPFAGQSMAEVLSAVLRDEPAPLNAPGPVGDVVRRCMAKRAADRYASMSEVIAALAKVNSQSAEQPSIAVLPFANMSGDKEQEYFSDGLAEEIINALVKIPGLKVIARTSAFAFKGQNTDIRKIAETLGVANILEGSVRRAGNRVRITAQLITAADGSHLWSERYDRQMEDIFAVQDEISAAIASAMKLKLSPQSAAAPRHQPSLPAYEAYLRYRSHQWGFTQESLRRSRECLEQAIELDPEFALPYVGLADHYLASTAVAAMSAHEAMPRARELARKALELNPALPEGHAMLGIVAGMFDLDWSEAGRQFGLATGPEAIPWPVRCWYSLFYLTPMGRGEEAQREAERVLQDNPLDQIANASIGTVLKHLGKEEEAVAAYHRACEIDPHFWWGWFHLGLIHAVHGRNVEALQCAEKAAAAGGHGSPYGMALSAGTLMNAGETGKAEELLAKLRAHPYGAQNGLACYHLSRGEFEAAVESALKAVDERVPSLIPLVIRQHEKSLRKSPGWPALLKKLNLPEKETR